MDRQPPPFDLVRRNLVARRRVKRVVGARRRKTALLSSVSTHSPGWRTSFLSY